MPKKHGIQPVDPKVKLEVLAYLKHLLDFSYDHADYDAEMYSLSSHKIGLLAHCPRIYPPMLYPWTWGQHYFNRQRELRTIRKKDRPNRSIYKLVFEMARLVDEEAEAARDQELKEEADKLVWRCVKADRSVLDAGY